MNDRFNFRIWNKQENKYLDGIFAVAGSGRLIIDLNILQNYDEKSSDCIIEQCTGLKDKNGNLIYEGDILQTPDKDQYIVEWIVDGYWHIRQIDDEKFGCALASIKTLYDGWEIIGNIHEHPEQKDK